MLSSPRLRKFVIPIFTERLGSLDVVSHLPTGLQCLVSFYI